MDPNHNFCVHRNQTQQGLFTYPVAQIKLFKCVLILVQNDIVFIFSFHQRCQANKEFSRLTL